MGHSSCARLIVIAVSLVAVLAMPPVAVGQFHDPDPEALSAFEEMVKAYRERPGLGVRTTVTVTVAEGDMESEAQRVDAEFLFGPGRLAKINVRDFIAYVGGGSVAFVHAGNDEGYFQMADRGSPYYVLTAAFMELPHPHLAIFLGEDDPLDLCMELHPKAPWARPTAVETVTENGRTLQKITMTSDFEEITLLVDPETRLLESVVARITGGHLVQQGTMVTYRHSFEYDVLEDEPDGELVTFEPGERRSVDALAMLLPERRHRGRPRGGGAVVGEPAPPLTLDVLDGGAVDLHELHGRVVVLDFWATWCQPCLRGLPLLHEVYRWADEENLPVEFFAVNIWEITQPGRDTPQARRDRVREVWAENDYVIPVAMDYADESAASWGIGGIPVTIVIRPDGIVHARHSGVPRRFVERLREEITDALREGAAMEE